MTLPDAQNGLTAALLIEMNGFLNAQTVSHITDISLTEMHRLRALKRFPEPETIKGARKGFRALDVMCWIDLREDWSPDLRAKWMEGYQAKKRGMAVN